MKAALVLLLAFGIQISGLVANNIGEVVNTNSTITLTSLAPTVPMEATFGDIAEFSSPLDLNPVVPIEAWFCDNVELVEEMEANSLSPVLPLQADFDDGLNIQINDASFAPMVPTTAEFSDTL